MSNFWTFEKSPINIFNNCDIDTIQNKCFSTTLEKKDDFDTDCNFRKASIVHKLVRNNVRNKMVNGAKIKDLVEYTETCILELLGHDRKTYFNKKTTSGIAFPVGVSVNNVIAHDSSLLKDERCIIDGDIIKFDFGVHVEGCIIDSAFTYIVGGSDDNPYTELLNASKEATYSAIAVSGPDARLLELSELVEEVICSYQVPIDYGLGELDILPIQGLGGHNILPYKVHGGKLILSVPDKDVQEGQKMEEGEIYAIETYATTGSGTMTQESVENRNGLPFTLSWCDRSHKKYSRDLANALKMGDIQAFPILRDANVDAYVSQFEHTIRIRDSCVEVYSLGNDY